MFGIQCDSAGSPDQRAPKMPNEERDPSESSSEKRSDQTGAIEIKFSGTAAVLLEFLHLLRSQKVPFHKRLNQ